MGNFLSLLMLAIWPAVAAVLFSRLEYRQAAIWTLLLGYLILPPVVGIKIPMVPYLGKEAISGICAAVGVLMLRQNAKLPWIPTEGWVKALLGLMLLVPFITMATNPEPLTGGLSYRPGLRLTDAINGVLYTGIEMLPFVIGYMVISSTESIRMFMRALVIATLAYSLPMLLEVRVSPQLNVWVYGFFAHDFSQSIRYGGYRPMVFLTHGLWVAMFAVMGVLAAATTLREAEGRTWRRALGVLVYLLAVLFMCKSVASMAYAVLLVPVILLTPTRWQMRVAGVIATLVLVYPLALYAGLVPVDAITDFIMELDEDRGHSLRFRFDNELILMEHASQKFLAGWGDWGRNLIIDPYSGEYVTVADGQWIIILSLNGILGFIAMFGLLCGSVIRIWRATAGTQVDRWTAALALIMAANLIDLIPNATLTPLTWLGAGALAGLAARGVAHDPVTRPAMRPALSHPPFRTIIG